MLEVNIQIPLRKEERIHRLYTYAMRKWIQARTVESSQRWFRAMANLQKVRKDAVR